MKKQGTSNKTGGEQLIDAIRAGDLALVKTLIAGGANVNEVPEEESPLGVAVELGNGAIVDALLKAGADASNGGLSVPLVTAGRNGDAAIVKKLLDAGAEVDAQEEGGFTALMAAANGGHLAVVKLLLKAKADATIVDEDGQSALLLAKKHPAIVKLLTPRSAKEKPEKSSPKKTASAGVDAPDSSGRTKLYHAAQQGVLPLAKELLAAGANINAADEYGTTPFLAAIGNTASHRAMLKWLAESGADIHAKDAYGRNFLSLANRYLPPKGLGEAEDQEALRKLLIELGLISESGGALTKAAGDGDVAAVKKLLDGGTSVDATDEQDRTALFMAVSRQRAEVVALLLTAKATPSKPIGQDDGTDVQYGGRAMPCPKCKNPFISMVYERECPACGHHFDVRKTYNDGPGATNLIFTWSNNWTPLMAAARLNDTKAATLLLDAGAKVDAGRLDTTPLMCACAFGHVEMARLLIERGANVNAVCKDTNSRSVSKITAVDVAGEAGNLEMLELLWTAGAKTENKDAVRIVLAAKSGDVKIIQSLLKAGVDANSIDPFSKSTPVSAAANAGQPETLRALLAAGASIEPAKRAVPPLLLACSAICDGLGRGNKTAADVPRYVETIKLLLDTGAPVKISVWGVTPLGRAKEAKCQPIIDLLESALATQDAVKTTMGKAIEKKKTKK